MKIAVSHCNGRISPVFDVSENLLLIEESKERRNIVITGKNAFERAREVSLLGVSVLICGAISSEQERAVRDVGVEVKGFICGDVEAIISAFSNGSLDDVSFMMPGCCNKRRMHRHGHCCRKKANTNKTGGTENA